MALPVTIREIDEQARAQLTVLRELNTVLSALHIRFWLRGGWAVDFLLGRVTRPHADLDLVMWARHRDRARRGLLDADFQVERKTAVQTDYLRAGQEISIVYLARAADGTVVTDGIPGWSWRADALPRRRWHLHGVSSRVVSLIQLLEEKEGYERGTGRPPRPKDMESIATLRRMQ
jgi:hypothetical protein